jgi:YD repeat-containing protein
MKIKHTLTLLAIVTVLLAACKKSANNTPPAKKLKYLTQTTAVRGTTTFIAYSTYDDKKRLSTVKAGTSTTTYSYGGSDNNLVYIESVSSSPSFRETIEFTYASDGTLSSAHDVIYRNGALSSDIVYNYLVVNGRITEIHHEGIYVDKYTYDDRGNVINVYLNKYNYNNVFSFDDKPSATTNGFPRYIINSSINFASPNNVVSNKGGNTYTYTYDTDGYPTGAIITDPTGATTKTTYTYTEM